MTRRAGMARSLMLWLIGAVAVFWLAAVALGAYVMREEFDEVFDSALQETANRLLPILVENLYQRGPAADPRQVGAGEENELEFITYQLRDAGGRVLMHSHAASRTPFEVPLVPGFARTPSQRIYTVPAVSGTLFLQVADQLDHRREALGEGALALVLPLVALLPLAMLAVWLVVRRAMGPVDALRAEIGARDGANLEPIAADDLPPELAAIAASVDRLLARLRLALEAEREFAANSAHELRTPIAGALAQTQRLVAELPDGPSRSRARQIEASLTGFSHLVEKLLQLARAESGIGAAATASDLVPVVRLVARDFERQQSNAGRIRLDIGPGRELVCKVDIDALAIVLRNLIENALLHSPQESPVGISLGDNSITVSNDGPVVPAEKLADLTKRFTRGSTGAAGAGLGLSIAATLASRMGAELRLNSPAPGRQDGFEADLVLPSA
jgi:two-component system OmpR family sensor kinase